MKEQISFKILNHCIACTTCSTMAPATFALNLSEQMAIVINQPSNVTESAKSMAALKSCPVSAIGVEKT